MIAFLLLLIVIHQKFETTFSNSKYSLRQTHIFPKSFVRNEELQIPTSSLWEEEIRKKEGEGATCATISPGESEELHWENYDNKMSKINAQKCPVRDIFTYLSK